MYIQATIVKFYDIRLVQLHDLVWPFEESADLGAAAVPLRDGVLSSAQLNELDKLYQHVVPSFAKLISEYEQDKVRCRHKLPSRKDWTPPARQLTEVERSLLAGPSWTIWKCNFFTESLHSG